MTQNQKCLDPRRQASDQDLLNHLFRLGRAKERSLKVANHRLGKVTADYDNLHKIQRHLDCSSWFLIRSYPSEFRFLRGNLCRQRIVCPACDLRRSAKLLRQWAPKLDSFVKNSNPNLFLLTLTIKNQVCLKKSFNKIKKHFLALRTNKSKKNPFHFVRGWLGQYEVTRSNNSWHPHLHLIIDLDHQPIIYKKGTSPFLFQTPSGACFECPTELHLLFCNYWLSLTGDSYIVDLRPIERLENGSYDTSKALFEVLKYVAKPCDDDGLLDESTLLHIASTLKGSRLMTSGGSLKDLRDLSDDESLLDDELNEREYIDLMTYYLGNGKYSHPL